MSNASSKVSYSIDSPRPEIDSPDIQTVADDLVLAILRHPTPSVLALEGAVGSGRSSVLCQTALRLGGMPDPAAPTAWPEVAPVAREPGVDLAICPFAQALAKGRAAPPSDAPRIGVVSLDPSLGDATDGEGRPQASLLRAIHDYFDTWLDARREQLSRFATSELEAAIDALARARSVTTWPRTVVSTALHRALSVQSSEAKSRKVAEPSIDHRLIVMIDHLERVREETRKEWLHQLPILQARHLQLVLAAPVATPAHEFDLLRRSVSLSIAIPARPDWTRLAQGRLIELELLPEGEVLPAHARYRHGRRPTRVAMDIVPRQPRPLLRFLHAVHARADGLRRRGVELVGEWPLVDLMLVERLRALAPSVLEWLESDPEAHLGAFHRWLEEPQPGDGRSARPGGSPEALNDLVDPAPADRHAVTRWRTLWLQRIDGREDIELRFRALCGIGPRAAIGDEDPALTATRRARPLAAQPTIAAHATDRADVDPEPTLFDTPRPAKDKAGRGDTAATGG